jgi:hypothetical protein
MWVRDLGCQALGLTISRDQFRHVAGTGLPVRLGDAELTTPPGYFDCAVLLESLEHIRDKVRLLTVLRLFCGRLVMRVNCQVTAPPGSVFAGTMHMISSAPPGGGSPTGATAGPRRCRPSRPGTAARPR